VDNLKKRG